MNDSPSLRLASAFDADACFAAGPLAEVALAVRAHLDADPMAQPLVFDDATGAVIDLDLRGDAAAIVARLAPAGPPRGRGRPKLGVVPREVTLLPRHWDWLARQSGGASATLRRLVDAARRDGAADPRAARDAAYRFMSAMAGDRAGFEEAARALFAGDRPSFDRHAASWPTDIRTHVERLMWGMG